MNRLTQAAYPAGYGTWTWSYDAVGNRTQQVNPSGITDYTYDANNRLTRAGVANYTYDANGNMVSSSIGEQASYDPFNRLTQATGQNGTATYTYNGDGLKVKRVGPDGTTLYYYDGLRPIWETDAIGNLTTEFTRDIFGNLLVRREANGNRRYFHADALGSTTALTDEAGNVTATVIYDAWGAVRLYTNPELLGKYLFTGAEAEGVVPMYHIGARFYAPTLGRWLSEDPIQNKHFEPLTLNFYAYVQNNPLRWIDPTGLQSCDLSCLNEQRQAAAMAALELQRLTGQRAVDVYRDYLGDSRTRGHEAAMADLVGQVLTAAMQVLGSSVGDYVPTAGEYYDINVVIPGAWSLTVGGIFVMGGGVYGYAGVAYGTPGVSLTVSPAAVTEGLNIAVGGNISVRAFQAGTAFRCPIQCRFVENGVAFSGSPLGFAAMVFFVRRLW